MKGIITYQKRVKLLYWAGWVEILVGLSLWALGSSSNSNYIAAVVALTLGIYFIWNSGEQATADTTWNELSEISKKYLRNYWRKQVFFFAFISIPINCGLIMALKERPLLGLLAVLAMTVPLALFAIFQYKKRLKTSERKS